MTLPMGQPTLSCYERTTRQEARAKRATFHKSRCEGLDNLLKSPPRLRSSHANAPPSSRNKRCSLTVARVSDACLSFPFDPGSEHAYQAAVLELAHQAFSSSST